MQISQWPPTQNASPHYHPEGLGMVKEAQLALDAFVSACLHVSSLIARTVCGSEQQLQLLPESLAHNKGSGNVRGTYLAG